MNDARGVGLVDREDFPKDAPRRRDGGSGPQCSRRRAACLPKPLIVDPGTGGGSTRTLPASRHSSETIGFWHVDRSQEGAEAAMPCSCRSSFPPAGFGQNRPVNGPYRPCGHYLGVAATSSRNRVDWATMFPDYIDCEYQPERERYATAAGVCAQPDRGDDVRILAQRH